MLDPLLERLLEATTATIVNRQHVTLMQLGYSAAEASRLVAAAMSMAPRDADLLTWLPTAELLDAPLTDTDIERARLQWYATAPAQFKRMLDAGLHG